jgi:CRP-like cAMP-binding protein
VEEEVFDYLSELQKRWIKIHPNLALYYQTTRKQKEFEPFQDVLTMDAMRHGCPWRYSRAVELKADETILWKNGDMETGLFLVHTGAVAIYDHMPNNGESWGAPLTVHRHGVFLNLEAVSHEKSRHCGVAYEDGEVICWDQQDWFNMTRDCPHMASAICRAVFKQRSYELDLMETLMHLYEPAHVDEVHENHVPKKKTRSPSSQTQKKCANSRWYLSRYRGGSSASRNQDSR